MPRRDPGAWRARGQWGSSNGGSASSGSSGKSKGRASMIAIGFVVASFLFVLSPFVYIIVS